MEYSHDWLHAFVPHDRSPDEVASLIGRHVATIDEMRQLRADLAPIVIARVLQAGRHPNSDHLWVTKVDDGGGEVLDVVCGAPNVTEGALYPFARVGTVMPTGNKGGILIERRKIRGEVSNGMLCSAKELGLGEDHDGILALDIDAAPGTPLLQALPLGDVCLEVDVLANRPDLLSHRGMARELSALLDLSLNPLDQVISQECGLAALAQLPDAQKGESSASSGGLTVRIEDSEGCPRFTAAVIAGVKIGSSPDWLVRRLNSLGLRPISNVVDATNYMLHAVGQPMHAYDAAKLAENTIVVRKARASEKLRTLDGVERELQAGMTIIGDAESPTGIAGVMGGFDSEVTADTTDIVLEVAYFSPSKVRSARRALGMNTDASYRFERGVDPEATLEALYAAVKLIIAVAGGTVRGAPLDVGAPPARPGAVLVRPERMRRLLGDDVATREMTRMLRSVGFDVTETSGVMEVTPPSWRRDVSRDADILEEIARLRGYDVLPDQLNPFRPGTVPDHPYHLATRRVRDALVAAGLFETKPLPFVSGNDESYVRVANPLAEDEPHLRRSILETLAARASYNLSRMQGDVRLFETGSVFEPANGDVLPRETLKVGAIIMGRRRPVHFTEPNPPSFDQWDAKALGAMVGELLHQQVTLEASHGSELWRIIADGKEVGIIRALEFDRPAWAAVPYGIEVTIGELENAQISAPGTHQVDAPAPSAASRHQTYHPLPAMPATEFDLALLVPADTTAAAVEAVIRKSAGELLESLVVFDEFRGAGVPEGYRSVGWRLTLRDPVRTLRDKEIEGRRKKILQTLERELGIRPRS